MTRNKKRLNINTTTTISIPNVEYVPAEKGMLISMKRRLEISDKIFDFKDIVLIFIWAVVWWWVSYFSVDEKMKVEYKNRLIQFSVIWVLLFIILYWIKYQKKEFINTILYDINEIIERSS